MYRVHGPLFEGRAFFEQSQVRTATESRRPRCSVRDTVKACGVHRQSISAALRIWTFRFYLQFNVMISQMMCSTESLHKLTGCFMGIPNLECDTGPVTHICDTAGTGGSRLGSKSFGLVTHSPAPSTPPTTIVFSHCCDPRWKSESPILFLSNILDRVGCTGYGWTHAV